MISAKDGEWLAKTFKCSDLIAAGFSVEQAERLTRTAIEFSKAVLELPRDTGARISALEKTVYDISFAVRR